MGKIRRLIIARTDGTELAVTPNLADTLNFEATLRKNPRWGSLQENALKMQPFRAWSAARREGLLSESWEDFANAVIEVRFEDDEDAEESELAVDGLGKDTPTNQPTIS